MTSPLYQFQVGDFECIAVQDAELTGSAERFFSSTPGADRDAIVRANGFDPAEIPGSNTCLVVNTGKQWVLIDSGNGAVMASPGNLVENLQKAGISPADIGTIILSHGHGDHYGGLIDASGQFVFPNARYFMWKDEWEFWTSDARLVEIEQQSPERVELIRQHLLPIASKLQLLENEQEFLPGIRAIYAPGHTPHHISVAIESGGKRLLFVGDALLHHLFVQYPDWEFFNDADHASAKATRYQLIERASQPNTLMMAYHFEFPSLGCVEAAENGYRWKAIGQ